MKVITFEYLKLWIEVCYNEVREIFNPDCTIFKIKIESISAWEAEERIFDFRAVKIDFKSLSEVDHSEIVKIATRIAHDKSLGIA
jgi:hypothetical protein